MTNSMHSVTPEDLPPERTNENTYGKNNGVPSVIKDPITDASSAAASQTSSIKVTHKWYDMQQARITWRKRWNAARNASRESVSKNPKVFGLSEAEENKIEQNNTTYVKTQDLTERARIGSSLLMGFVGYVSKVLMTKLNYSRFYNMDVLYNAVEQRDQDQGLLTFCNHRSVVDEPFLLASLLPARILFSTDRMRWGLCSLDICFQNGLIGRALRPGKALSIKSRGGISQEFLSAVAEKLTAGQWVHIYPEGRVNQKGMGYAKRGAGKLVVVAYETGRQLHLLLPIYHEGSEHVMTQNHDDNCLKSTIPRRVSKIFLITGDMLNVEDIFERFMPACREAGGTQNNLPPCIRLYEEVAELMSIALRLIRAELRERVQMEDNIDLEDPYEFSKMHFEGTQWKIHTVGLQCDHQMGMTPAKKQLEEWTPCSGDAQGSHPNWAVPIEVTLL